MGAADKKSKKRKGRKPNKMTGTVNSTTTIHTKQNSDCEVKHFIRKYWLFLMSILSKFTNFTSNIYWCCLHQNGYGTQILNCLNWTCLVPVVAQFSYSVETRLKTRGKTSTPSLVTVSHHLLRHAAIVVPLLLKTPLCFSTIYFRRRNYVHCWDNVNRQYSIVETTFVHITITWYSVILNTTIVLSVQW